jgi:low affinity Fe/Cu permease
LPAEPHAGPAKDVSGKGPSKRVPAPRPLRWFRSFSHFASRAAGTPVTFLLTLAVVVVWVGLGSVFRFSDKWLLVMSTATSVLTFLMVFLIQATQNRDTHALQLKLDELIRSTGDARNFFVRLEGLPDEAIKEMQAEFDAVHQKAMSRLGDKPKNQDKEQPGPARK